MLDDNDIRRTRSRGSRLRAIALAGLAASTVLLGAPRTAHAEEVSPDGKGIVGGALIGAELVVFGEALFGVRSTTAYIVGGSLGAVAGGVGGYAIETSVDDGRVPAYMLAGGLALIIPALVITLDQTRYLPTEGAREDKPVTNLPPSDPSKPGGSSVVGAEPPPTTTTPLGNPPSGATPTPVPAPTPAPPPGGGGGTQSPQRAPQRAPMSLINFQNGGLRVGMPVPEVRPVFTVAQRKSLGVESAGNELRFPVMNVAF